MLLLPSTDNCPKELTRDMRGFFNSLLGPGCGYYPLGRSLPGLALPRRTFPTQDSRSKQSTCLCQSVLKGTEPPGGRKTAPRWPPRRPAGKRPPDSQHFERSEMMVSLSEQGASFVQRWKGKQLTSMGKLVTRDKMPVRCVLRRKRLIFNNSSSTTKTGTGEAKGSGRHRAQ
jgi:hypothetical protein